MFCLYIFIFHNFQFSGKHQRCLAEKRPCNFIDVFFDIWASKCHGVVEWNIYVLWSIYPFTWKYNGFIRRTI